MALCVGADDLAALAAARAVSCRLSGGPAAPRQLATAELAAALDQTAAARGRRLGLRRGAVEVSDGRVRRRCETASAAGTDDALEGSARCREARKLAADLRIKAARQPRESRRQMLLAARITDAIVEGEARSGRPRDLEGVVATPMQKHFHMETHSARAVPAEGLDLVITASTQDAALTQSVVASVLGRSSANIDVVARRAGGAFGGKLTLHLPAATATAIVAARRGVPARYHADRRDDMKMTGGREACRAAYRVGFDAATGKLSSYVRRADLPLINRGDAAATTWIFRGDESRRRRGCDADVSWRRVARS